MSATVTVGGAQGQWPTVFPCQVSVNGGAEQAVSVVVSGPTMALVPETDLQAYVQARATLAVGDGADATATVTPKATSDPQPNWAQQWLDGAIPS